MQVPPPPATVPTQLSASAKSVLDEVICVIVSGAVPASMMVAVSTALLTPRGWFPKFTFAGARAIPGVLLESTLATKAVPAPVRLP